MVAQSVYLDEHLGGILNIEAVPSSILYPRQLSTMYLRHACV
jgi:hypothetical protein